MVFATSGWDQDANWVIDDGRDYPRLVWEGTAGQPIRGRASDRFEGDGTPLNPYHIATVEQFALIGIMPGLWDKHFVLDADLDLAGVLLRPIGTASWQAFNGFFHGNRHVLRHFTLEIDEHVPVPQGYESHGSFGYIGPGGRISRLGVEDVAIVVNGGSHVIGTLAVVNEGVITGCYATGVVNAGQSQSAIGLVGHNSGVLARSYTQAEITGSNWTGGLVGSNYAAPNPGFASLPAKTTYAGIILECYAARSVPKGSTISGLTGANDGLVLNSYFLTESEETPSNIPARRPMPPAPYRPPVGTPLTDAQMRQQSSFVGWDFTGSSSDGTLDRWHIADGNYPILSWQMDLQGSGPVPDIADLPLDWARAEIESAGFIAGEVRMPYDYHSVIPKERAILSSPVGIAPLGSTVDIIASRGSTNCQAPLPTNPLPSLPRLPSSKRPARLSVSRAEFPAGASSSWPATSTCPDGMCCPDRHHRPRGSGWEQLSTGSSLARVTRFLIFGPIAMKLSLVRLPPMDSFMGFVWRIFCAGLGPYLRRRSGNDEQWRRVTVRRYRRSARLREYDRSGRPRRREFRHCRELFRRCRGPWLAATAAGPDNSHKNSPHRRNGRRQQGQSRQVLRVAASPVRDMSAAWSETTRVLLTIPMRVTASRAWDLLAVWSATMAALSPDAMPPQMSQAQGRRMSAD